MFNDSPAFRLPLPILSQLPDDIRERIEQVQQKAGFVPNVFLVLAHRPHEFRAFFAYHDALMLREESALSKAEREMIVVATSGANQCHYCVIAHGAILRLYSRNPLLADQLAINYRTADITERQRLMLDFALKVATDPASLEEADHQRLRDAGFDDEAIWDIGNIAAFFALSNRMAHVAALKPNAEFYSLGR